MKTVRKTRQKRAYKLLVSCFYTSSPPHRESDDLAQIPVTAPTDLEKVWLILDRDQSVPHEKIDDDQAAIGFKGGRVILQRVDDLADGHELRCAFLKLVRHYVYSVTRTLRTWKESTSSSNGLRGMYSGESSAGIFRSYTYLPRRSGSAA